MVRMNDLARAPTDIVTPMAETSSYQQGPGRRRSAILLVSLLTLLAIGPWLNEHLVGLAIWELLFTLVMLSGISSLSANRRQARVAVFLAAPAMACLWLRQFA